MLNPMTYYRPTRTSDGERGFTEALGDGSLVYGAMEYHETELTATVRRNGPLQVGDILEADGEYYTVMGFVTSPRAGYRRAILEKRDRPTHE